MIALARNGCVQIWEHARRVVPGLILCSLVAMAAQFVSDHTQSPAMLMALLFGMAISFLGETETSLTEGISFTAKSVLKIGIVLLGARISAEMMVALGWEIALLLVGGLVATMLLGYFLGKLFGQSTAFSILTAGAVSICGASAALAISSVLPRTDRSERQLSLTILGVTALSTVAMILYPVILGRLGYGDAHAGVFIGATIHDVAQVVGAGFSISEPAGEMATLVKLIRVTLLAPTVIVIALIYRSRVSTDGHGARPPILPHFVIGFLILAALNSFGFLSESVRDVIDLMSRAALLTAIAAVGVKTNLREIMAFGYMPVALIVAETIFLAIFAGMGLAALHI